MFTSAILNRSIITSSRAIPAKIASVYSTLYSCRLNRLSYPACTSRRSGLNIAAIARMVRTCAAIDCTLFLFLTARRVTTISMATRPIRPAASSNIRSLPVFLKIFSYLGSRPSHCTIVPDGLRTMINVVTITMKRQDMNTWLLGMLCIR